MEDYAYILDYMPQGRADGKSFKRTPLAYAIGDNEFKLLELIPKDDAIIQIGDKVYIGKDVDRRDRILHVKRRIGHKDLTGAAQSELLYILEEIVMDNETRFLEFYNKAHPISTRFHMLELLPGMGKKTLKSFLDELKKGKFQSFADISERVEGFRHPEKLIVKRIELELEDADQKYRLFVAR